ncbi:hypothetical protein HDK64DRAFT_125586 [Phyllosticta capitalensis]
MPRPKTSLEHFNATDLFYPGDNGHAARNFPTSLFPTSTIAIMDMAIPNSCAHPHRTPMLAIKVGRVSPTRQIFFSIPQHSTHIPLLLSSLPTPIQSLKCLPAAPSKLPSTALPVAPSRAPSTALLAAPSRPPLTALPAAPSRRTSPSRSPLTPLLAAPSCKLPFYMAPCSGSVGRPGVGPRRSSVGSSSLSRAAVVVRNARSTAPSGCDSDGCLPVIWADTPSGGPISVTNPPCPWT